MAADAKADKAKDPVIVSLTLKLTGLLVVLFSARAAYEIRTYAIQDYGRIIHECAPRPGPSRAHADANWTVRMRRRSRLLRLPP